MNVKRVLPILLVLAGFSVPVQAQGTLPVQVVCTKLQGFYKPICNHVKKAVNASSQFRQAKNGNRYVVILVAQTGEIDGGLVDMSIVVGAILSDPLTNQFPYHIVSVPWVFAPSESRALGAAIVSGGLPVAVDVFSDVVDEINSYGTSGTELEFAGDDILEEVKLEMHKFLKEQTN